MTTRTLKYLAFLLLLLVLARANAAAQSDLQKCSGPQYTSYSNCVGTWSDGKGFTYSGQWQNGLREGRGEAIYANGDHYYGEFKDNKANGQGLFVMGEGPFKGDKYIGEFKADAFSGQGTYIFGEGPHKGDKYVGEFQNDAFNGQGSYTFANGSKIVGQFQDGNPDGPGIDYTPDGTILEQGTYQKGKLIKADAVRELPAISHRVQMVKKGNTYEIPGVINDVLVLNFIVDSGASNVVIPKDVARTLFRTGTIKEGDFLGIQQFELADGSITNSALFIIRSIKVGDQVIQNVRASIGGEAGPLLLGQSFLERFKSWSMDYTSHELVLE